MPKKFPIDLGRKYSSEAMPMAHHPKSEKSYPSLYLDWDDKYDLPESGEMTVKFEKTNETNTKDKEGNRQSVTLKILEICCVESKKEEEEDKDESEDGGKALDKLMEEAEDAEE